MTSVVFCACQIRQTSKSSNNDKFLNLLGPIPKPVLENVVKDDWDYNSKEDYASYYYLLAEYLQLQGYAFEAEELLSRSNEFYTNEFVALKLIETKIEIAKKYLQVAGRDQKLREVYIDLKRFNLIYPNSLKLKVIFGKLAHRFGEKKEAYKALKEVFERDEKNLEAGQLLIEIYLGQGKINKALKIAKKITEIKKNSAIAWMVLARIQVKSGEGLKGLKSAKKAYYLDSRLTETNLLYAYLLQKNNKKQKAAKILEDFFSNKTSIEDVILKTVAFYRSLGDLNQIYIELNDLSKIIGKTYLGVELQKIFILWSLKRFDEALTSLKVLYERQPDSVYVHYLLGRVYQQWGNITQADYWFKKIIEESLYFIPANIQRIKLYEFQGQGQKALNLIQELTQSRFTTPQIFIFGASLYSKVESYEKAINLLREGIKKFPDYHGFLFLIGVYQEKSGNIKACINTMVDVLRNEPNHSGALNYLGYLWVERGVKLNLAEKLILRALSVKPHDGYYLDSLGWLYFKKKEYEKSYKILLKAVESSSGEGVILEHVGDVLVALKRKFEAVKFYKRALKGRGLEEKDKLRISNKIEKNKKVSV